MMLVIFWLVLFVVSLGTIGLLVARHFNELAAFDTSSVPQIQEKTTKQALVHARIQRNIKKASVQVRARLSPVAHAWESFQKWFRNLANSIADQYRDLEWKKKWMEWKSRTRHERRAHLLKLLEEGDEHRRADRYPEAEKNYIEIISLDPKNVSAYIGLAKAYFNQDKYKEAEEVARHVVESLDSASELAWAFLGRALKAQSKWADAADAFKHALKLNPLMAKRWIDLGDCYKEEGGLAEAIGAFRKAAEIEPNNPRVLDQLIGISIISGDKRLAREAFLQLQAVNPENQKLVEWEAQIGDM